MSDDPDLEHALIDGTVMSVDQTASGAKGRPRRQAIGRVAGDRTGA
ncbi:transporter [Tateyamaria omphalii]|nr:transporter [Tateyamaria omphalii]